MLVRAGAVLHTALPPAGHRVRLPALVIESDSPQAAARFRLVRAAGDWVELETTTLDPKSPTAMRRRPHSPAWLCASSRPPRICSR